MGRRFYRPVCVEVFDYQYIRCKGTMGQDGARRNRLLRSAAEVAGYHPKSSEGAGLQTVDVEDSVEVIGLMLENYGGEAADRVTDDGNG